MQNSLKPKETGLSSNAMPVVRFSKLAIPLAALLAAEISVAAQGADDAPDEVQEVEAGEASEPPTQRRQFTGIDLSVTVPKDESDRLLEEDCEEEADAGRIAGEIVVCRQLGEASDGSWNKEEWEKGYAERTAFKGDPGTPNTFGIANHGNAIGFGSVPPPAIFIDVEALPQAPAGSDADRIARGLPPLGEDPEPTPEEIAERRRALGLDAPPVPSEEE